MKKIAVLTLITLALSGAASADSESKLHEHKKMPVHADGQDNASLAESNPLKLADGSLLFISEGGTMHMVDNMGKPLGMKEGVEMVLEDGSLILMHNKKVFRHIHKGRP